jgi:hypothetical protein
VPDYVCIDRSDTTSVYYSLLPLHMQCSPGKYSRGLTSPQGSGVEAVHVTVLLDVVQVLRVRPNAELKNVLKVDAKRNGEVYPSSFLATRLVKSDVV